MFKLFIINHYENRNRYSGISLPAFFYCSYPTFSYHIADYKNEIKTYDILLCLKKKYICLLISQNLDLLIQLTKIFAQNFHYVINQLYSKERYFSVNA